MKTLNKISVLLYWLAICISISNLIFVLYNDWGFIADGKGLGSFTALWIVIYIFISLILWGASFLLNRNKKKALIFFITILIPMVMLIFFPIYFYVE